MHRPVAKPLAAVLAPLLAAVLAALLATVLGASAGLFAALSNPGLAHAADPGDITDGLLLRYRLDATTGTTAEDSSGHGRTGTINGTPAWGGADGLGFNGADTYVKLPDNIIAGLGSITVAADVFVDPAQASPYFIYGLGNTAAGLGNGYLFTTGNDYRTSIATGNWSTEQTARPATPHNVPRGSWKHLAYTLTGGTAVLYEDWTEVGRMTGVTIKPSDIGGGTTTANAIGRSLYSADSFFKGRIRDFRIYDRALTGAEVAQLGLPEATRSVALDKVALALGDTSGVLANLALPAAGTNGSVITWASSDPSVIKADGTVTRPAQGRPDATVRLTATLVRGGVRDTRSFDVTVLAEFNDSQKVNRAVAVLTVPNLSDVRGNLTLPTTGAEGTTVSWQSDRPSVIAADGTVHRPATGAGSTTVVLIATVTRNQASSSRTFVAKITELPAARPLTGYLFSYFTGENTPTGEQVYFGLSKGNDPLHWRELNGGRPTLTSTLGEQGLRDPFIIRSPDGDKFYQIATDLRIYGNGNWDAAQRNGSKSIMVWESTDLVHWTDQRLVRVSPDSAGNTWAPEAYYDSTLGAYVVFWASQLFDNPGHTGTSYNRMMYATTRDFYTFSEPKVWYDPGYAVIDSTMIQHNGTYYRFTKDERGNSSATPCGKFVFEQWSATILNPSYGPVSDCIGKGSISQGEGPAVFKSNTEDKWYLLIDENGGRGYVPFESTDLASGKWTMSTNYTLPAQPRHGTVLPVTQAEYDRLLGAYAPAELVTAVDDVAVRTPVRRAPALPATVVAHHADGSTGSTAVTWDSVPATAYALPGTFTVLGTLPDGASVRARTTVTVYGEENPNAGPAVTGAEGAAIALAGTVSGTPAVAWTYRAAGAGAGGAGAGGGGVDAGATCAFTDPHAAATSITCTDDGSYQATLTAGDLTSTATVTVTNAAPTVGAVHGPAGPVVDQAVTLTAPFTDPGGNDTQTCTVDWGDGSTTAGTLAQGTCSASHPYRAAGTYDATIAVTDDDGGAGSATLHLVVTSGGGGIANLPVTGFQAALAGLVGAALLLLGGILYRLSRRPRRISLS